MTVSLENSEFVDSGGYGIVYKGNFRGRTYCIKRRLVPTNSPPGCIHVNEVDMMCRMDHPNILQAISVQRKNPLKDDFRSSTTDSSGHTSKNGHRFRADLMYIIMDYYPYTLHDVNGDMDQVKSYMWQILSALHYIHSMGMIHCDIKPANILIHEDQVKICDFDMVVPYIEDLVGLKGGTRQYNPPEVLENTDISYTPAVDIWSAGCILYFLLKGEGIFPPDRKGSEILEMQKNLSLEDIGDGGLLQKMLQLNPDDRPSALECMKHPFFQGREIPQTISQPDHRIEYPRYITTDLLNFFRGRMDHCISPVDYFGLFLGLDILMRVCTDQRLSKRKYIASCCYNMGMKYFSKEYGIHVHVNADTANDIEAGVIKYLDGHIYRPTLYSTLSFHKPENALDILINMCKSLDKSNYPFSLSELVDKCRREVPGDWIKS